MSRYVVVGHINVQKSNVITGDFLQYLHSLKPKYRLDAYGVVTGMEAYKILSHEKRTRQLFEFKKYAARQKRKGKLEPYNVHTFVPNSDRQRHFMDLAKRVTPNEVIVKNRSRQLWDMTLDEALQPLQGYQLPEELVPSAEAGDVVTLDNKQYPLAALPAQEAEEVISRWRESVVKDSDKEGPQGFLFAVHETYWFNNDIGVLGKSGQTVLYDHRAKIVRAAIIASRNLSLHFLENYSDGDLVTARYDTRNQLCPTIIVISYYADREKDPINNKLKNAMNYVAFER